MKLIGIILFLLFALYQAFLFNQKGANRLNHAVWLVFYTLLAVYIGVSNGN
jgi:predicted Abi (CAAX) family protease